MIEQKTTGNAGDEDAERAAETRQADHRTAHILRCFLAQQSGDRQDHAHLAHADQHTTQVAEWRKGLLLQAEQRVADSPEQQGGHHAGESMPAIHEDAGYRRPHQRRALDQGEHQRRSRQRLGAIQPFVATDALQPEGHEGGHQREIGTRNE